MTFTPSVNGVVSTVNSSTTPLAANAAFTGTGVDVQRYNSVVVSGTSDVPDGALVLQFSSDNTNWDADVLTAVATTRFTATSPVLARYFRVVYTNGPTGAQSTFRLQSVLKTASSDAGSAPPATAIQAGRDTFGRMRVGAPVTLFSSKFLYSRNLADWDEITTGTGAIAYTAGFPFLRLTAGTATGRVVRQTRTYFSYQPGKAFEVLLTGTLEESGGVTGAVVRVGIFDDASDKTTGGDVAQSNGFYFQLDGTALSVARRTYISGSLVTTTVGQSSFNLDRLDGTGPSGVVIDVSKRQIFFLMQEWLGVGAVTMGIVVNETYVPCHKFRHANLVSSLPYTNRASLPLRYEISTAGSASSASLVQVCCTVVSNGGFAPRGNVYSVSNGITGRAMVNSRFRPLVALRCTAACNRATLNIIALSILGIDKGDALYAIYRYPAPTDPFTGTGSAAGTWIAVDSNSRAEYNVTSSFPTAGPPAGGILITQSYFSDRDRASLDNLEGRLISASDIAGNADILVVAARTIAGGSADLLASVVWQEWD